MSALGHPPQTSELAKAANRALEQRLRYADWPDGLKSAYNADCVEEDRDALRFHQIIGLIITFASCAIDWWSIPDQAELGLVLRLTLVVPLAVCLVLFASRLPVWQLKLGTALTLTIFAAIVTHLASFADPATATRYTMATSFMLGMGVLMLPFRRNELAGFVVLFVATTLLAAIWPNPIAQLLVVEHMMVNALVAGGTLILALRMNELKRRNFLLKFKDRFNSLELQENNRVLRQLSEIDALTGLANRRAFTNAFNAQFKCAANETDRQISLMMIDLDRFKLLNDTHGHQAGDRALRHVARYLQTAFQDIDGTVARFGGEEFVAVLRCRSIGEAEDVAETIRAGIAELEIPTTRDQRLRITTSIGLASSGIGAVVDLSQLTARADRALYAAKDRGRNQVVLSERIELRVDRLID